MAAKTRPCQCDPNCDATTRKSFAPGHDARMVSKLALMVAAGSIDLESAAQRVLNAGGSRALIAKLVERVRRLPVQWTRITDVTLLSPSDQLVIQWSPQRADRDLAPWLLSRTSRLDSGWVNDASSPLDKNDADSPRAFWSISEAVAWQAKRQIGDRVSDWVDWRSSRSHRDLQANVIDTWEWMK